MASGDAPVRPSSESSSPAGSVDGILRGTLSGWLHDADADEPAEISLLADGEVVARTIANRPRPDVEARLGAGSESGFRFELDALETDRPRVLRVVHERSSHDFHGAAWTYSAFAEASVRGKRKELESLFFPEYYRYRYRLETLSNEQSFRHYLENGIYRDHDPCPWFSNAYYRRHHAGFLDGEPPAVSYIRREGLPGLKPSSLFDPVHYLADKGDLSGSGPLAHFVARGSREKRRPRAERLPEHVLDEIRELTAVEPALATASTDPESIVRYPFVTGATYLPRLVRRRFGKDIDAIVCVSFIDIGGADLIATYVLKAYQRAYGIDRVLLIVTDRKQVDVPDWLPERSRVLCLDLECEFSSPDDKVRTLHAIIGLLAPRQVVNVNSRSAWGMYRKFGVQMASATSLYAYLFCFDYDANGRRVGYIHDYVPELLGVLTCIYCDNRTIIDEMRELYDLSQDDAKRFEVVYVPAPEEVNPADGSNVREIRSTEKARDILWIGRLARQKRPDLLVRIAASMPAQKFVVYGPPGDSPVSRAIIGNEHPNIEYRGVFSDVREIDVSAYRLLLNTSEWEGLPTLLIQMMAMGVPIVTSLAGGISELVSEETGWPVQDGESVTEYVIQLSKAMIQDSPVRRKVENGRRLIEQRHSWSAFQARLETLGAFAGSPP